MKQARTKPQAPTFDATLKRMLAMPPQPHDQPSKPKKGSVQKLDRSRKKT
jgi:hypothetical protein